jgi:hypothetical protein
VEVAAAAMFHQGIGFSASFAICSDLLVGWHGIEWFSSGLFCWINQSIELMALTCFLLQEVVAGGGEERESGSHLQNDRIMTLSAAWRV